MDTLIDQDAHGVKISDRELGCIHIQHCGIHSIWFPWPFSQTEGFQLIKDLIMTELQAQFSTQ